MDERAKAHRDRLGKLKTDRMNYDAIWDRIARVVLPTSAGFSTQYTQGVNLNLEIADSTPQLALPKFSAALDTLLSPQGSMWHSLQAEDPRVQRDESVRAFYYWLTERLFQVRYQPAAGFAWRAHETYLSTGAFGNGVLYVHDARPGIRYLAVHLSEIWFDQDINGVIDTAYWEHEYTIRQIRQNPEWDKALPKTLREIGEKDPDRKVKVVKAVYPRTDRTAARGTARNMPFASCVLIMDGQCDPTILEEGGYRTFPFAVMRYMTAPREIYGRGPAQDALADILSLQRMMVTIMRRGELTNDPSWLTADEDSLPPLSVRPGSINPGYLGPDGKPRVAPLYVPGDNGIAAELIEQKRQAINAAFLVNLFQAMAETSDTKRMTATEVMARMQEKGAMLAPIGGRIRTEFFEPLIARELDILTHAGMLDGIDIPEPIRRSDGRYKVTFESPLSRNMRAEAGIGILRTLETATQIAQVYPQVFQNFDFNRTFQRIVDTNNTPPDIIRPAEEVAAEQQAAQQQTDLATALQAAPGLADTAKTLVEANNLAGTDTGVI